MSKNNINFFTLFSVCRLLIAGESAPPTRAGFASFSLSPLYLFAPASVEH